MFFWCFLCLLVVLFKCSFCKPRNPELPHHCKWTNYSPIYSHCWLSIWLIGWLDKKGCAYVCACKKIFFLQKHREDSKAHICSSYSRLAACWMKTSDINESFLHCSKTQTWSCGMKIVAACTEFRDVNVCICMCILYIYIVI